MKTNRSRNRGSFTPDGLGVGVCWRQWGLDVKGVTEVAGTSVGRSGGCSPSIR